MLFCPPEQGFSAFPDPIGERQRHVPCSSRQAIAQTVQIRHRACHIQPVGVLYHSLQTRVTEAEHPLDGVERMFDPRPDARLAPVPSMRRVLSVIEPGGAQ